MMHVMSQTHACLPYPSFDAGDFALVPARTFEQLEVGEMFGPGVGHSPTLMRPRFRRYRETTAPSTTTSSGLGRTVTRAPVVHGLQILAVSAPGATLFPHAFGAVLVAFAGLSASVLVEVTSGDTLYPQLQISEPAPEGPNGLVTMTVTVHDQRCELVLSQQHSYLLHRSPEG